MKRVMAAALAVFAAVGLLAGSASAAQENARVKEIENTLMKQIGDMPKTGGGEKLGELGRRVSLEGLVNELEAVLGEMLKEDAGD